MRLLALLLAALAACATPSQAPAPTPQTVTAIDGGQRVCNTVSGPDSSATACDNVTSTK